MKENLSLKQVILIVLTFFILFFLIFGLIKKAISQPSTKPSIDADDETKIVPIEATTEPEDPNKWMDEGVEAIVPNDESQLEQIDGYEPLSTTGGGVGSVLYAQTGITDYSPNIVMNEDTKPQSSTGEKTLGNITIVYNTEDAYSLTGSIGTLSNDSIVFTDNTDAVLGYAMASELMKVKTFPQSIDDAKLFLGEYIQDCSGTLAEWEEADYYYVRRVVDYSKDDDSSVINFTLVPKKGAQDKYIYSIILVEHGTEDNNVKIKQSSYDSMMEPIKELCEGSEFLTAGYEADCDLLDITLYRQTANGSGVLGELDMLRKAAYSYQMSVYGENKDQMTDEELLDAYTKHTDPIGYDQTQEFLKRRAELNKSDN